MLKLRTIFTALILLMFTIACSSPEKKAKEKLKDMGIEFNQEAFFIHVVEDNAEVVRLFIRAGISPDVKEGGITALLEAARRGNTKTAMVLIDAGADVNARDGYGVSALMFAAISGSAEIMQKLLQKDADVNVKDSDGRTVLIEALTTENEIPSNIFRALINAGADVNVKIYDGIAPLMLAVFGDPQVIQMLIDAGADVNAKDIYGATAMKRAKYNPESVKILREAGAKE